MRVILAKIRRKWKVARLMKKSMKTMISMKKSNMRRILSQNKRYKRIKVILKTIMKTIMKKIMMIMILMKKKRWNLNRLGKRRVR